MQETKIEAQGEYETSKEAIKQNGKVNAWIQAIDLQEKSEEGWREDAAKVSDLYVNDGDKKPVFNILYSNTQTIAPAIYNTPPIPDIRERYGESQEGRYIAELLERCVKFFLDQYEFHPTMQDTVLDSVLVGRGVPRIRYNPEVSSYEDEYGEMQETIDFQSVSCELVEWDSLIVGPAKRWESVPWIAFKHYLTRDQLIELSPEHGKKVDLNEVVEGVGDKDVSEVPSMYKRALVYEVWDKETGMVHFIARSYRNDFLDSDKPQIKLHGFYPIPRPLYAAKRTGSLCPVIPYSLYKEQAKELDIITKRITSLTKCLKWRGVYAKGFDAFSEVQDAGDGDFIPTDNDLQVMAGMGLDRAVLFMPIDMLVSVLRELYVNRDQIKQTIYEITGISDIIRGATKAQETLGAQQLKAQWGSVRLSEMQGDVQRLARDLIRMKVEVIAENFEPQVLEEISGMSIPPNILALMRNDLARRFIVDIETDSTIKADLSQSQQNVSQFVAGFGQFIQAVGPAVQAGAMSKEAVIDLLLSFSRNFKLGRKAENALESMKNQQQPQGQGQQAQQQEMQLEKYKIDKDSQTKLQVAQMDNQTDLQKEAMKQQAVF